MTNSSSNHVYEALKAYRQQLESAIEKQRQRQLQDVHIHSLLDEWTKLQAVVVKNEDVSALFLACAHVFDDMLQPTFLQQLNAQNLPASKLASTYLQQVTIYFETLEMHIHEVENIHQVSYHRLQWDIESFCKKVAQALESYAHQSLELATIIALEQSWIELKKHSDAIIQQGYCANTQFQQASHVASQLFHVNFMEQLQQHDARAWQLLPTYLQQLQIFLTDITFEVKKKDQKRPFLVDLWTWTLQKLEMLSVFYIIRNVLFVDYTKANYRFVDAWLLGHTLLAVVYVVIANQSAVPIGFKYALLVYGCLRMFEVLIYQLNVILVHPYNNANYSLNSYRRMTIALIHNFIEIIFWFAGTFITLQFLTDSTVPLAVYTSFTHMVTYSMELDDSKWTVLAIFILQFQAAIGVFMTVLSLARFVSLFPQPASLDPKEQEANEVRHTKLIEEINNVKETVEKNSARIAYNEHEIDQIQREGEHTHNA